MHNYDQGFAYDAIGNRLESRTGTATNSGGILTEYFGKLTPSPVAGANDINQYVSIKKGSTTIEPGYDDDGNATDYPVPAFPGANSALVWDAENRLISTSVNSVTTTHLYDAQSRKFATTTGSTTILYLYDDWNCIAEYSRSVGVSPTLQKTRLWGLDLSNTLQGAGGVGGLLSETINNQPSTLNFFPTYDGNGNISEYLAADGSTAAHFEYDSIGNTVVNTDTSNQFAYRFSTKPQDTVTGWFYYTYRYYDPLTGRWPSRDPIGETGGVNLYVFVGNDGMNLVDVNGLTGWATSWPQDGWKNNTGNGTPFAPTDSLPPGLGGLGPEVNQSDYYNDNFGDIVDGNISLLSGKINDAARVACGDEPSSVDIAPEVDAYPGGGNSISNIVSMNLETGRAVSSVKGLQITWWNLGQKKTFSWTAEMTLSDSLGYNPPGTGAMWNENLMYHTLGSGGVGLLPHREVIRGRWPISGSGECPCDPKNLY